MPSDTSLPWNPFAAALAAHHRSLRVARACSGGYRNSYREVAWPTTAPVGPYAVPLADDQGFRTLLLDLDCDDAAARERQQGLLAALLTRAGIGFVSATSGPSGHRHLLATFHEPVPADRMRATAYALKRHAPDLDISQLCNPATGSVRPPAAPHRSGGGSRAHGDRAAALAVLTDGNPSDTFDRLARLTGARPPTPSAHDDTERRLQELPRRAGLPHMDRPRRPLTAENAALLRHGDTRGRYDSRSAMATGITDALIQAGWRFDDYLAVVLDWGNIGLEHLRTELMPGGRYRRRVDVEAAARRMWERSLRWVLTHSAAVPRPSGASAHLTQIADAVANTGWGGQGGVSARAVIDVLLALAIRLERDIVAMSARRLAIAAGLSRSTAAAAVHRLISGGWLAVEEPARGTKAAVYRLLQPGRTLAWHPPRKPEMAAGTAQPRTAGGHSRKLSVTVLGTVNRAHDAFTSEGMGRTAGYIADTLHQACDDVAGLSARTGLHPSTVSRYLRRMEALGLAQRRGDIWISTGSATRDAAAIALRVTGTVARREREYHDESANHAWWLADFAAERGYASARGLRRAGRTTTRHGTPCPSLQYPRGQDGRRSWREGMDVVRAGLVTQPSTVAAETRDDACLRSASVSAGRHRQSWTPRRTPARRSESQQPAGERGEDALVGLTGEGPSSGLTERGARPGRNLTKQVVQAAPGQHQQAVGSPGTGDGQASERGAGLVELATTPTAMTGKACISAAPRWRLSRRGSGQRR